MRKKHQDGLVVDSPEVSIWIYDIRKLYDKLPFYEALINNKKYIRDRSTLSKQAKRRFILRKGITMDILAGQLGITLDELMINKTSKGKPFIPCCPLSFNISHSGEYIAVATTCRKEVGIDVQKNLKNVEGFPYMILSDLERELCHTMDSRQKEKFLLRIWTCKEALVKAVGDGLTVDVSKIDLSSAIWPKSDYIGSLAYDDARKLHVELHSLAFEDYVCSYVVI